MKKLKSIVVAVLIVGMTVMPAFGYVNHSGLSEGPTQTPADIEMIFGIDNLKGLEVAELSDQEMKDTQGLWAPVVYGLWVFGTAAISAWTYHGRTYYNTGKLGTAEGAAWAATKGGLTAMVGPGVTASCGLRGASAWYMNAQGLKTGYLFDIVDNNRNMSVGTTYNVTGSTHTSGNISVGTIR